jgi:hypothetical protein
MSCGSAAPNCSLRCYAPSRKHAGLTEFAAEQTQYQKEFSWCDPEHAAAAVQFALRRAVRVGASDEQNTGLERALDLAQHRGETQPELAAQALALFVTHFARHGGWSSRAPRWCARSCSPRRCRQGENGGRAGRGQRRGGRPGLLA